MRAIGEIRTAVGVLLAVQLVTTFGMMGLLTRMSPTIERVLEDDVSSMAAVEGVFAAMTTHDCGESAGMAEKRFDDAIDEARDNAATPMEAAYVDAVDADSSKALAGECDARMRVVGALDDITDLNLKAATEEHVQARRLGGAGAWATALLGLVTFAVAMISMSRLANRLASPLAEIEAVVTAVGKGDPYRRCKRIDASAEYRTIAVRLNQLLDRRLAKEEGVDPQLRAIDRALLHHLLDRMPEPMVAVDTSGAILAASEKALDILAGTGGSLSDALAVGPEGPQDEVSMISRVEPFGANLGFLVTLHRPEGAPEGGEGRAPDLLEGTPAPGAGPGPAPAPAPAETPTAPRTVSRSLTTEAMSDGPIKEKRTIERPDVDPKGRPDEERD